MTENRFVKWFYRNRTPVVIVAVILLLSALAGAASVFLSNTYGETETDRVEELAEEALQAAVNYYRENRFELDSWWDVMALQGAGVDLYKNEWVLPAWKSEKPDTSDQATDLAGFTLGLLALGENPATTWPEKNLIQNLLDKQEDDGSFGSGINNTIWAVIALDCAAPHEFTREKREKTLSYLLPQQKNDGGFAYSGETGDPDMTAMALHALVACRDNPGAGEAITEAVDFLREHYLYRGGFASYGQENANSVAMVISSLIAAGEDPLGTGWTDGNSEINLLDNLLSYQLDSGAFTFTRDNPVYDPMATVQALIALGDIVAGETVFARLKETMSGNKDKTEADKAEEIEDVQPEDEDKDKEENDTSDDDPEKLNDETASDISDDHEHGGSQDTSGTSESSDPSSEDEAGNGHDTDSEEEQRNDDGITPDPPEEDNGYNDNLMEIILKVVGREVTHYNAVIRVDKNGITPVEALEAAGLSYETMYDGAFVTRIAGEKQAGNGAGWKFKVNGEEPGGATAANYHLSANDHLTWWHAENPDCTGP